MSAVILSAWVTQKLTLILWTSHNRLTYQSATAQYSWSSRGRHDTGKRWPTVRLFLNVQWWLLHICTPYCVETTSEASQISLKPQITAEWMFQGNSLAHTYIYSNRILTFSLYNLMAVVSLHGWSETAAWLCTDREERLCCTYRDLCSLLYVACPSLIVSVWALPMSPPPAHAFTSFIPVCSFCWWRSVCSLTWGHVVLNGNTEMMLPNSKAAIQTSMKSWVLPSWQSITAFSKGNMEIAVSITNPYIPTALRSNII